MPVISAQAAAQRFRGSNLMVDLLVLREPVVNLPRRAALATKDLPDGAPNPRSGLARLKDFSVITELKVSASQIEGLDYTEVVPTSRSSPPSHRRRAAVPRRPVAGGLRRDL